MRENETDDELLQASADDPEAFAVFYRRHCKPVLVYMHRATRDAHVAADLTADVFAAAFSGRKRFRPQSEPARAWLFGICRNVLLMRNRRLARAISAHRRLPLPPIEFDDADMARAEEELCALSEPEIVSALVAGLPAEERQAVEARVLEEQDYKDLADRLGITESAVRKRVSRGLRRVRAGLGRTEA